MEGIVGPASQPRNSPEYGRRFRATTEDGGSDGGNIFPTPELRSSLVPSIILGS